MKSINRRVLEDNATKIIKEHNDGKTIKDITKELNLNYNTTLKESYVSDFFKEEEAKAFVYAGDDRKERANSIIDNMQKRYERACQMVDWLADSIEKIRDGLMTLPPEEYAIKFIKISPVILSTSKEIISQLEFLKVEQEKINEKTQDMILSPIEVNIQMTKKLKEWNEKGYIKILKALPEGGTQYGKEEKQQEYGEEVKEE